MKNDLTNLTPGERTRVIYLLLHIIDLLTPDLDKSDTPLTDWQHHERPDKE